MNRVILSGEIGSDIVLKKTATGQSLCNFSIEVKEKERTDKSLNLSSTVLHGEKTQNILINMDLEDNILQLTESFKKAHTRTKRIRRYIRLAFTLWT